MTIKLSVSLISLLITAIIMSFVYEGRWGFSFIDSFYESKNNMRFPFLIHFLFVSHFILATYYFFYFRKSFKKVDLMRLTAAIGLGSIAYGSYVGLSSTTGKSVFDIVRYQLGYFHIFFDELKLFFRLDASSSRWNFVLGGIALTIILFASVLVFFYPQYLLLAKIGALLVIVPFIVRIFNNERLKINTPYFLFNVLFFLLPFFLIVDGKTFEKLGIFYFCYHVVQCYIYFPASQLFGKQTTSIAKPLIRFAIVVFLIHGIYLGLGYFGLQTKIIPNDGISVLSKAFFSNNWEVSSDSFLNFPFIILFDVYAYKFWGVFHILHCFFYDRLLLRSYLEL